MPKLLGGARYVFLTDEEARLTKDILKMYLEQDGAERDAVAADPNIETIEDLLSHTALLDEQKATVEAIVEKLS